MFYFYLDSKTGIFISRWNIHCESMTQRTFKLSLFFLLSLFKLNHRSFNFRLDQDRNFYLLKKKHHIRSHTKNHMYFEREKKTRTTAMLKMCLLNELYSIAKISKRPALWLIDFQAQMKYYSSISEFEIFFHKFWMFWNTSICTILSWSVYVTEFDGFVSLVITQFQKCFEQIIQLDFLMFKLETDSHSIHSNSHKINNIFFSLNQIWIK